MIQFDLRLAQLLPNRIYPFALGVPDYAEPKAQAHGRSRCLAMIVLRLKQEGPSNSGPRHKE